MYRLADPHLRGFTPYIVHVRRLLSVLVGYIVLVASLPCDAQQPADIVLPDGFRAELVYSVSLDEQGSWVSLTVDDRGRLIASDQYGALYRVTPAPLGEPADATQVEQLNVSVGSAHGLLYVNDSLYVTINGSINGFSSGLYRLKDTTGDDQFDRVEQLRAWQGAGEHGPHAIVLGPDGKSLYLCNGNMTAPPDFQRTFVNPNWQEDQLLPRIFDPRGHATNIRAPGGWIARTDLDGKELDLICTGFRNEYDIAFNSDGELFTFDADMEWDIGTPWYRPTRICHVVKGGEYGWRSGNGKWPSYYLDSLPATVDVGPGSPTGITFGYGTNFPEKYRNALLIGDWSYGNIYAVHMAPKGASYQGVAESFATASPLAVTDMVVRPQDGALYFAVGGRKTNSALFRVVWTGGSDSAAQAADIEFETSPTPDSEAATAREFRERLAAFQTASKPEAIDAIWPYLADQDRFIRFTARTALERQPIDRWIDRGLRDTDPRTRVAALAAAARSGQSVPVSSWIESLVKIDFANLPVPDQLDVLRTAMLGILRLGPLPSNEKQRLIALFDPHLPADDFRVTIELTKLLVALEADGVVERVLPLIDSADTQEQEISIAVALSAAKDRWSTAQRERLLDWFIEASNVGGGMSCFGYLESARERFIEGFDAAERTALKEMIDKPLAEAPAQLESASRPFVKEWKLEELIELADEQSGTRDFESGRRLFSAASCYQCHRVAGAGSTVGPDLTGAGSRFSVPDLLRAIVEPSHQISDQYQTTVFLANGRTIEGRVTNLNGESIHVSTNMLDPKRTVTIRVEDIEEQRPSDASVMPEGLLNTLTQDEVLDLLAFLRAGGDPSSDFYKQQVKEQPAAP